MRVGVGMANFVPDFWSDFFVFLGWPGLAKAESARTGLPSGISWHIRPPLKRSPLGLAFRPAYPPAPKAESTIPHLAKVESGLHPPAKAESTTPLSGVHTPLWCPLLRKRGHHTLCQISTPPRPLRTRFVGSYGSTLASIIHLVVHLKHLAVDFCTYFCC